MYSSRTRHPSVVSIASLYLLLSAAVLNIHTGFSSTSFAMAAPAAPSLGPRPIPTTSHDHSALLKYQIETPRSDRYSPSDNCPTVRADGSEQNQQSSGPASCHATQRRVTSSTVSSPSRIEHTEYGRRSHRRSSRLRRRYIPTTGGIGNGTKNGVQER